MVILVSDSRVESTLGGWFCSRRHRKCICESEIEFDLGELLFARYRCVILSHTKCVSARETLHWRRSLRQRGSCSTSAAQEGTEATPQEKTKSYITDYDIKETLGEGSFGAVNKPTSAI
jgi:hypothetical protein